MGHTPQHGSTGSDFDKVVNPEANQRNAARQQPGSNRNQSFEVQGKITVLGTSFEETRVHLLVEIGALGVHSMQPAGPADLGDKCTSNLPMMPEGINYAAESPPVFLSNRDDLGCASRHRPFEDGIRMGNRQIHPNSTLLSW